MTDPPQQPGGGGAQPAPGQQYGGPPQYGQAAGPSGPRASFGQRLGAALLDTLITVIPIVLFVGGVIVIESAGNDSEGTAAIALILISVIATVGVYAYYIVMEGGPTGQTIGKKMIGIRVVDFKTGGPIGYGKATVRLLIRSFVSGSLCALGYLWMLWDKEKQTWHDKLSESVVVPVTAYPIAR